MSGTAHPSSTKEQQCLTATSVTWSIRRPIFERHGRWYIQFMTHPDWGTPLVMTDPYQDAGDFYAVSEGGPLGPYHQPKDEVVAAARRHVRMGASRTVDGPDGERYFYGWLLLTPAPGDTPRRRRVKQVVPQPRRVRFAEDGSMQVTYHEGIERFCRAQRLAWDQLRLPQSERWRAGDGVLIGKDFSGRSLGLWSDVYDNLILSVRIRFLRGHRAGLTLRVDETATSGWQVVADRGQRRIEFGLLGQDPFIDARHWEPCEEFTLRVVALDESVEVYCDDRLVIHQVRHRETSGRIGVVVERAEAQFSRQELKTFHD